MYLGLLHCSKPFLLILKTEDMPFLNVEIKAKCNDAGFIRNYLLSKGAEFRGVDEQTDTYFNVSRGRLKLREGNIENNLIYYERNNQPGPKNSHFHLLKIADANSLKEVLTRSIGVKVIVKKKREIYYIKNVKFHIDDVPGLGSFIEIEAGNILTDISQEKLKEQCEFYLKEFDIKETDLIEKSYSDMLLDKIN
jgi:predicted adenylyl cyclase CyaB